MGRRDRERKERISTGREKPFRNINNPIGRKLVAVASRKGIVNELSKGTVDEQVSRLEELRETGTLPNRKLKETIMRKAPKEMDKGISKFQKQGKPITVESLLSEVRSTPGFLAMCERVGLSYSWFENLALSRMKAKGLV